MRRPQIDGGGEWVPSLALFTVMLPASVGVYAWWLLFASPPQLRWVAPIAAAIGLASATLHLGHLLPGPLILTRLGRSWLAREVVAAGLFTALTFVDALVLPLVHWPPMMLLLFRLITLAVGGAGGIASIQLYRVASHPSWRAAHHFVWGICATAALGSALALAFRPSLLVRTVLGFGVAGDLVAFLAYLLYLSEPANGATETFRGYLYHLPLTLLRVGLPVAGYGLAQLAGPASPPFRLFLPAVYLIAAHLLHRLLFYKTGYKQPVVNMPYYAGEDAS